MESSHGLVTGRHRRGESTGPTFQGTARYGYLNEMYVLRNDEKLHVFETIQEIDGVGTHHAWNIADHVESRAAFMEAEETDFEQVDGIGPALAERLAEQ